jgi:arylsulfatase A-like enzyme
MKEPDEVATDVPVSWSHNLRQTLTIAAFLGLLAGFGEGLVDLTFWHYHTPPILCVTLLADLPLFLALGIALWLLFRAFRRNLDPALALFILLFTLLYSLVRMLLPGSDLQTYLLIESGAVAMLATLYKLGHRRATAQAISKGLLWVSGLALICLVAVPVSDALAEWRALDSLPTISPNSPNVVLVIIDTLRADHLSVYGYERPTSPNIDQLAKQGVLFDDAISAASWTLPSHASMMTGTYAHVHHTDAVGKELPSKLVTLASVLDNNGHRTAAFSANTFLFTREQGFGQGFTHFGDFFQSPADALSQVRYIAGIDSFLIHHHWLKNFLGRQTAPDINRAALRWIDSSHRPFFLTLNYLDVHDPYVPPQPWRHMFSSRMNPGGRIDIGENMIPNLSRAQVQDEMDAYDGGVAYADHELGLLIAALSQRGLLSNTLLVVTSDHGEAFGSHGLLDHANALYFSLIHVPLVFRWPGHIPGGVRVSRPVSTKDIGATILALIHSRPNDFPGESLAALWDGKADSNSWPLPISELAKMKISPSFPDDYGALSSVVAPDLQLIVDPRRGLLLYDWKTDPKEVHNLYNDPRYSAIDATLATDLKEAGARPLPPSAIAAAPAQAKNRPLQMAESKGPPGGGK